MNQQGVPDSPTSPTKTGSMKSKKSTRICLFFVPIRQNGEVD